MFLGSINQFQNLNLEKIEEETPEKSLKDRRFERLNQKRLQYKKHKSFLSKDATQTSTEETSPVSGSYSNDKAKPIQESQHIKDKNEVSSKISLILEKGKKKVKANKVPRKQSSSAKSSFQLKRSSQSVPIEVIESTFDIKPYRSTAFQLKPSKLDKIQSVHFQIDSDEDEEDKMTESRRSSTKFATNQPFFALKSFENFSLIKSLIEDVEKRKLRPKTSLENRVDFIIEEAKRAPALVIKPCKTSHGNVDTIGTERLADAVDSMSCSLLTLTNNRKSKFLKRSSWIENIDSFQLRQKPCSGMSSRKATTFAFEDLDSDWEDVRASYALDNNTSHDKSSKVELRSSKENMPAEASEVDKAAATAWMARSPNDEVWWLLVRMKRILTRMQSRLLSRSLKSQSTAIKQIHENLTNTRQQQKAAQHEDKKTTVCIASNSQESTVSRSSRHPKIEDEDKDVVENLRDWDLVADLCRFLNSLLKQSKILKKAAASPSSSKTPLSENCYQAGSKIVQMILGEEESLNELILSIGDLLNQHYVKSNQEKAPDDKIQSKRGPLDDSTLVPQEDHTSSLQPKGNENAKSDPPGMDTENVEKFSMQSAPQGFTIQCRISRDRREKNRHGLPIYYLYYEREDGSRVFLLAGKKQKKSKTSTFVISADSTNLSTEASSYMGKIRSNKMGTKSTLFDKGLKIGDIRIAPDRNNLREELAAVCYQETNLQNKSPPEMTILLPAMSSDNDRIKFKPLHEYESMLSRWQHKNMENIIKLCNKAPCWDEETKSYMLDFHGRVTEASSQNCQIIHYSDPEYIVMQFGKVNDDIFVVDYNYPLSAFQAFAIALSTFDRQPAH